MRCVLAGVAVALLSTPIGITAAERGADCQFKVQAAPAAAKVTGPEEVASRARVLAQSDSPIAITKADFSGSQLVAASGHFEWQSRYTLQLLNVSDKPVSNVRAAVHVRSQNLSGIGDGARWEPALAPGAHAELVVRGGRGSGGFRDYLTVDIFVEEVTLEGCVYRPSQAIPALITANR